MNGISDTISCRHILRVSWGWSWKMVAEGVLQVEVLYLRTDRIYLRNSIFLVTGNCGKLPVSPYFLL